MFGWKILIYFVFGMVLSECQCLDMWQYGILTCCVLVNGLIGYWEGVSQKDDDEEEEE